METATPNGPPAALQMPPEMPPERGSPAPSVVQPQPASPTSQAPETAPAEAPTTPPPRESLGSPPQRSPGAGAPRPTRAQRPQSAGPLGRGARPGSASRGSSRNSLVARSSVEPRPELVHQAEQLLQEGSEEALANALASPRLRVAMWRQAVRVCDLQADSHLSLARQRALLALALQQRELTESSPGDAGSRSRRRAHRVEESLEMTLEKALINRSKRSQVSARRAHQDQVKQEEAYTMHADWKYKAALSEENRRAAVEAKRCALLRKEAKRQETRSRGAAHAHEVKMQRIEIAAEKEDRSERHQKAVHEEREYQRLLAQQSVQDREHNVSRTLESQARERHRKFWEKEQDRIAFEELRKKKQAMSHELKRLNSLDSSHRDIRALQRCSSAPGTLSQALTRGASGIIKMLRETKGPKFDALGDSGDSRASTALPNALSDSGHLSACWRLSGTSSKQGSRPSSAKKLEVQGASPDSTGRADDVAEVMQILHQLDGVERDGPSHLHHSF